MKDMDQPTYLISALTDASPDVGFSCPGAAVVAILMNRNAAFGVAVDRCYEVQGPIVSIASSDIVSRSSLKR